MDNSCLPFSGLSDLQFLNVLRGDSENPISFDIYNNLRFNYRHDDHYDTSSLSVYDPDENNQTISKNYYVSNYYNAEEFNEMLNDKKDWNTLLFNNIYTVG